VTEPDHIIRLRLGPTVDDWYARAVQRDIDQLLADYDRLRRCLEGVAGCCTCEVCRGAAQIALEATCS
jgi:hypothetical protein